CGKELKKGEYLWCNKPNCDLSFLFGQDDQEPETLNAYAPAPSFIDTYNKKRKENGEIIYEMKEIHPVGKNSNKYRRGKVRISLFATNNQKVKTKGKVKDTDLNEIKELVKQNETFIYEEWKSEVRQNENVREQVKYYNPKAREEQHEHPKLLKLKIDEERITAFLEDKREISIPVSEKKAPIPAANIPTPPITHQVRLMGS
ncbi:18008_t:CDS:2, partial [Racocetra persica]